MTDSSTGFPLWTYRRPFTADGLPCLVTFVSGLKGVQTVLSVCGVEHDHCFRPSTGPDSIINHQMRATLPSGKALTVEAGYFNWINIAIAARVDGLLIHESHPGTPIRLPERAAAAMVSAGVGAGQKSADQPHPDIDFGRLKANRVPIAVDVATGLLFFIVAKLTDLTTAALVGAAVGLALVVAQRFVKVDLLGGLAMFGIVMLMISGAFAWVFQDDEMIKQRSTVVGLIGAGVFLTDGLVLKGRKIGRALSRYLAYTDINEARLATSLGLVGLAMAAINFGVAQTFSTDVWLFYTTFGDVVVSFGLALTAINWSRTGARN